jgi:hypothetical protein
MAIPDLMPGELPDIHEQLDLDGPCWRRDCPTSVYAGARPTVPTRIRQRRRPGWRLPPGAVSVANGSRFANPFRPKVRTLEANAAAVEAYRDYLEQRPDLVDQARQLLAGRDLACVCEYVDEQGRRLPCHADVLLELVNRPGRRRTPDGGAA